MSAKQLMLPAHRAFNSDGAPEAGAKAFLYLSGGTTPANFYEDAGLTVPLGHSITANAAGRFSPMPYGDSTIAYRIIIQDAEGTVLDDIDPFYFGLVTGVDGANATVTVNSTANGVAGGLASVTNSGTTENVLLDFVIPTGAQGPAGDVAKAADRTALAAIIGLAGGEVRYLAESNREGHFVFSNANHASDVTGDPQQGVFVPLASDTTGASGAWVRKATELNPYMFGGTSYTTFAMAKTGTDSYTALQAMFTFCFNNPGYTWNLLGLFWTTTQTVQIQNADFDSEQTHTGIGFGGKIVGKSGSTGTDVIQIQAQYGHIRGVLGAFGDGNTAVASRGWTNGIAFMNCGGLKVDAIEGGYVKRHVAYESFLKIDGSSGGNNIGLNVGKTHGRYAGSAAGAANSTCLTYAFDSVTLNGTTNAVNQTSTVHFTTALDPMLTSGDWFTYTEASNLRTAYQISSIDFVANTITFYLWLPAGVSSGSMDSAHGGIVLVQSSNSDNTIWGPVNGENCGVIWNDVGLYGATVEYVSGDGSVGIHHIRGSNIVGGGFFGGMIKAWHSEAAYLDEIETLGVSSYVVGPSSARDVQGTNRFDLSYKSCPRTTSGARGGFSKKNATVHTPEDGWINDDAGFNVSTDAVILPTQTPTIDNRPNNRFYRAVYPNSVQQTLTVTLDYLSNYDSLFSGKNWAELQVRGTETRGGIKVSVTFQLSAGMVAAGWTSSGTLVHNQFKGPSDFFIKYDIAHKVVYITRRDHEPQELYGVAINGDVAATLAPGTATKTQIWNTPLTLARAVTLPTTGDVKDGDYFDIIRTAAATGTALLNVGTGPLIALGPSQWCRVTYSSTAAAWQLTDYMGGTINPTNVSATGSILSTGTTGVGYATGSGGAVTQITSRTTGVTINKPNGQITLVSAAGSTTWNTFTVTNSTVAAGDVVDVVQQTGANVYSCVVSGVSAGSFKISVSAVSGTATEAPVLNFAVTKAVAA